MITVRTIEDLHRVIHSAKKIHSERVGFVPTMGFLHEGHLSLIDLAREHGADFIVVSIFVNPAQFGPNEDFASYPRDEARDAALLEAREVDVLFAPSPAVVYPDGFTTTVRAGSAAGPLEGERRPGHFDGVATVVTKLFNMVQPDIAVFGQKDAQQCAVIRQLVRDLNLPVEIVIGPTTREADGLAMSSRNTYLNVEERALAPAFYKTLLHAQESVRRGADVDAVEREAAAELARAGIDVDYVRVVDSETFARPEGNSRDLIVVGAVRIGRTRLIDNIPIPKESARGAATAASAESLA